MAQIELFNHLLRIQILLFETIQLCANYLHYIGILDRIISIKWFQVFLWVQTNRFKQLAKK